MAPFNHHLDIQAVPAAAYSRFDPASVRGVATAIIIEEQANNAITQRPTLTVNCLRGQADYHVDLFQAINAPSHQILPVIWGSNHLNTIAYWAEVPAGSTDWQVSESRAMGSPSNPKDIEQNRLEIIVSTEQTGFDQEDITKQVGCSIAETLVAGLVRHIGSTLPGWQLRVSLETTYLGDIKKAYAQGTFGSLGIQATDSALDHNQFLAFLQQG